MEGWVPLKRSIAESPVMSNPDLLRVYIWCLLKANFKDNWFSIKTGKGNTEINVKAGSFITGRTTGSEALNLSPSTFRNRLNKLEKYNLIELRPYSNYTEVTIVDYGMDNQRPTKGHNRIKKRKKRKKL